MSWARLVLRALEEVSSTVRLKSAIFQSLAAQDRELAMNLSTITGFQISMHLLVRMDERDPF